MLTSQKPRFKPILKGLAAATAFAFTVTTLLPAGWATGTVPVETHLRVEQAEASTPGSVKSGLEEALHVPVQTESASPKQPTVSSPTVNFWVKRGATVEPPPKENIVPKPSRSAAFLVPAPRAFKRQGYLLFESKFDKAVVVSLGTPWQEDRQAGEPLLEPSGITRETLEKVAQLRQKGVNVTLLVLGAFDSPKVVGELIAEGVSSKKSSPNTPLGYLTVVVPVPSKAKPSRWSQGVRLAVQATNDPLMERFSDRFNLGIAAAAALRLEDRYALQLALEKSPRSYGRVARHYLEIPAVKQALARRGQLEQARAQEEAREEEEQKRFARRGLKWASLAAVGLAAFLGFSHGAAAEPVQGQPSDQAAPESGVLVPGLFPIYLRQAGPGDPIVTKGEVKYPFSPDQLPIRFFALDSFEEGEPDPDVLNAEIIFKQPEEGRETALAGTLPERSRGIVPRTMFRPSVNSEIMGNLARVWAWAPGGADSAETWEAPQVAPRGKLVVPIWDYARLDLAGQAVKERIFQGVGAVEGRVLLATEAAVDFKGFEAYPNKRAIHEVFVRDIHTARAKGAKVSPLVDVADCVHPSGRDSALLHYVEAYLAYPDFDWDQAYVRNRIWTTPEWKEASAADANGQPKNPELLKSLAWRWYEWHLEALKRLQFPWEFKLHTFIPSAELDPFGRILSEVLEERGVKEMDRRIVPVVMAAADLDQMGASLGKVQLPGVPKERMALAVNLMPALQERTATLQDEFAKDPAGTEARLKEVVEESQAPSVVVNITGTGALLALGMPGRRVIAGPEGWALTPEFSEQAGHFSDFVYFMIGDSQESSLWERVEKPRPRTFWDKFWDFGRSLAQGQAAGTVGGAVPHRLMRMIVNTAEGKFRFELDAWPAAQEGIWLKPIRQLQSTLSSPGALRVKKVEILRAKDGKTEVLTTNVLGTSADLHVPTVDEKLSLRVTVERDYVEDPNDPWWLKAWRQSRGGNAAVAVRFGKGYGGSGEKVQPEEWGQVNMPPGEKEGAVEIPFPQLVQGVNFYNIRLFGPEGYVEESVGPGTDLSVVSQYWPYLVREARQRFGKILQGLPGEKEGRLLAEGRLEEAAALRVLRQNRIGLAASGRMETVARMELQEADDPDAFTYALKYLRASGVTSISLRIPALEGELFQALAQRAEKTARPGGALLGGMEKAGQVIGRALEEGFDVYFELDAGILSQLKISKLAQQRESAERLKGRRQDTLPAALRVLLLLNQENGFGAKGILITGAGKEAREELERVVVGELNTPLIFAGDSMASSKESLQAAEVSLTDPAAAVKKLQDLADMKEPREKAFGHRWKKAVIIGGGRLSETVAQLEPLPTVGGDEQVQEDLFERLMVPTDEALLRQGAASPALVKAYAGSLLNGHRSFGDFSDALRDPQNDDHEKAKALARAWEEELARIADSPQKPRFVTDLEGFEEVFVGNMPSLPMVHAGWGFARVQGAAPSHQDAVEGEAVPVALQLTHHGSAEETLYRIVLTAYHHSTGRRYEWEAVVDLKKGHPRRIVLWLKDFPRGRLSWSAAALRWDLEGIRGRVSSFVTPERLLSRTQGIVEVVSPEAKPADSFPRDQIEEELEIFRKELGYWNGWREALGGAAGKPDSRQMKELLEDRFGLWARVVEQTAADGKASLTLVPKSKKEFRAALERSVEEQARKEKKPGEPLELAPEKPRDSYRGAMIRGWIFLLGSGALWLAWLSVRWALASLVYAAAHWRSRPPPRTPGAVSFRQVPSASTGDPHLTGLEEAAPVKIENLVAAKVYGIRQKEVARSGGRVERFRGLVEAGTVFNLPTWGFAKRSATMQSSNVPPPDKLPLPDDLAELGTFAQESVGRALTPAAPGRMAAQVPLGGGYVNDAWRQAVAEAIKAVDPAAQVAALQNGPIPASGWMDVQMALPPEVTADLMRKVKYLRRLLGAAMIRVNPATRRISVDHHFLQVGNIEELFARLYVESAKRLTPERRQGLWINQDLMAEMYGPVEEWIKKGVTAPPIHLDWRPWTVVQGAYKPENDKYRSSVKRGILWLVRWRLEKRDRPAMRKEKWGPGLMLRNWLPWGALLVPYLKWVVPALVVAHASPWIIAGAGLILGGRLTLMALFYLVSSVELALRAIPYFLGVLPMAAFGGEDRDGTLKSFSQKFHWAKYDLLVPLVVLWQVGGYTLSMMMRRFMDFVGERPNVEHPLALGAGLLAALLTVFIAWPTFGATILGVAGLAAFVFNILWAWEDQDAGRLLNLRWLIFPAFAAALFFLPQVVAGFVGAHALAIIGGTLLGVHLLPALAVWVWGLPRGILSVVHRWGFVSGAIRNINGFISVLGDSSHPDHEYAKRFLTWLTEDRRISDTLSPQAKAYAPNVRASDLQRALLDPANPANSIAKELLSFWMRSGHWTVFNHESAESRLTGILNKPKAEEKEPFKKKFLRTILDTLPSKLHGLTDVLFLVRDSSGAVMTLSEPETEWVNALDQKGRWYTGDILTKLREWAGYRLMFPLAELVHEKFYKTEEFTDLAERLMLSTERNAVASGLWRLMEDPYLEKWTGMGQSPPIIGIRPVDPARDGGLIRQLNTDVSPGFAGSDGRFITYLEGWSTPGLSLPYKVDTYHVNEKGEKVQGDGLRTVVQLLPSRTDYRFIMRDDPESLSKGMKLAALRGWQYMDSGRLALHRTGLEEPLRLAWPGPNEEQYEFPGETHVSVKRHLDVTLESYRGMAGDRAALHLELLADSPENRRGHDTSSSQLPAEDRLSRWWGTRVVRAILREAVTAASFFRLQGQGKALNTREADEAKEPVPAGLTRANIRGNPQAITAAEQAARGLLVGLKHHPFANVFLHTHVSEEISSQLELTHGTDTADPAWPYFRLLQIAVERPKAWGFRVKRYGREPEPVTLGGVIDELLGLSAGGLGEIVVNEYADEMNQRHQKGEPEIPFELYLRSLSPLHQDSGTLMAMLRDTRANTGARWGDILAGLHHRVGDTNFVRQWAQETGQTVPQAQAAMPDTQHFSDEFRQGRLHLYDVRDPGHRAVTGALTGLMVGGLAALFLGAGGGLAAGAIAGVATAFLTAWPPASGGGLFSGYRRAPRGLAVGVLSGVTLLGLAKFLGLAPAIWPTLPALGGVLGAMGLILAASVGVGMVGALVYLLAAADPLSRTPRRVFAGYAGLAASLGILFLAPSFWLAGSILFGIVSGLIAAKANLFLPSLWMTGSRQPILMGWLAAFIGFVLIPFGFPALGLGFALTISVGLGAVIAGLFRLLRASGPPYSRDIRILARLFGRTPNQFAGFWDSSTWQLKLGLPLAEGTGYFTKVPLWWRGGVIPPDAPPLTILQAIRILEVPPDLAPISAFNVLAWRRAYAILEQLLKAEDTLGGYEGVEEFRGITGGPLEIWYELVTGQRFRRRRGANPPGGPLPPAAAIFQQEMQHLSAELKQLDSALSRAAEFGLGEALRDANQRMFNLPIFTGDQSAHEGVLVTLDGYRHEVTVTGIARVAEVPGRSKFSVLIGQGPAAQAVTLTVDRDASVISDNAGNRYKDSFLSTPYHLQENLWGLKAFDTLQMRWPALAHGVSNLSNVLSGWTLSHLNFEWVNEKPGDSNAEGNYALLMEPDFLPEGRKALEKDLRETARLLSRPMAMGPSLGPPAQGSGTFDQLIGMTADQLRTHLDGVNTQLRASTGNKSMNDFMGGKYGPIEKLGDSQRDRAQRQQLAAQVATGVKPVLRLHLTQQLLRRMVRLKEALEAWDTEVAPVVARFRDHTVPELQKNKPLTPIDPWQGLAYAIADTRGAAPAGAVHSTVTLEQALEAAVHANPGLPSKDQILQALKSDPKAFFANFLDLVDELNKIPAMRQVLDEIRRSASGAGLEEGSEVLEKWTLGRWGVPQDLLDDPQRRQQAFGLLKDLRADQAAGWAEKPDEEKRSLLEAKLKEAGIWPALLPGEGPVPPKVEPVTAAPEAAPVDRAPELQELREQMERAVQAARAREEALRQADETTREWQVEFAELVEALEAREGLLLSAKEAQEELEREVLKLQNEAREEGNAHQEQVAKLEGQLAGVRRAIKEEIRKRQRAHQEEAAALKTQIGELQSDVRGHLEAQAAFEEAFNHQVKRWADLGDWEGEKIDLKKKVGGLEKENGELWALVGQLKQKARELEETSRKGEAGLEELSKRLGQLTALERAALGVLDSDGIFGFSVVNEGPRAKIFLFDNPQSWRLAPFIAQLAPVAVLTKTAEEAAALEELFEASGTPSTRYAVEALEWHRGNRALAEQALAEHFNRHLPAGLPGVILQTVPVVADIEALLRFLEGHGVVIYNLSGIAVGLEEVQTYLESLA